MNGVLYESKLFNKNENYYNLNEMLYIIKINHLRFK